MALMRWVVATRGRCDDDGWGGMAGDAWRWLINHLANPTTLILLPF